jgi:hypothetical protein
MRELVADDQRPTLVTWRTVWRAHIEFGLMLRFDDVIRLQTKHLQFDTNSHGSFIRVALQGGKTIMATGSSKNERLITPNDSESCLFRLTQR